MKFTDLKLNSKTILITISTIIGAIFAFIAGVTMDEPLAVYGMLFATFFIATAWVKPHVALAITFASGPLQGDVSGGFGPFRFSIAEINLLLCLIVFTIRQTLNQRAVKVGPLFMPVLIYMGIGFSSSLAEWHDTTVIPAMMQMLLYLVVAVLLFSQFADKAEDLILSLNWLILGCLFLSISGLAAGSFFILGLHKNGAGASIACGVVVATDLYIAARNPKKKLYYMCALGILLAGLVYTVSRGAWVGAFIGMACVVILRGRFRFLLQMVMVMTPLIVVMWNNLPEEKREYAADISATRSNIAARYESIEYAKNQSPQA